MQAACVLPTGEVNESRESGVGWPEGRERQKGLGVERAFREGSFCMGRKNPLSVSEVSRMKERVFEGRAKAGAREWKQGEAGGKASAAKGRYERENGG